MAAARTKKRSDGQRVCEPASLQAQRFDFSVTGASADSDIVLEISSKPTELSVWKCDGGNTYNRETTLLLLDWGIAVSGEYDSLTPLPTQEVRLNQS
jgi:hypothetical protein